MALFGPPPLIEGEDPAAYDELLVHISAAVKPADTLEDIWVRDVADFTWEIFALRRLKANLLTATSYKGVKAVLLPIIGYSKADTLASGWAKRKPNAIERVNSILNSAGLTVDAVMAQTLSENLDVVERIERMITIKEFLSQRYFARDRLPSGHARPRAAGDRAPARARRNSSHR